MCVCVCVCVFSSFYLTHSCNANEATLLFNQILDKEI